MANFVTANLGHEIAGGYVNFKVDAKLRFDPKEVGHRWLFQVRFLEEDVVSDDQLSPLRPSEAFGDPSAHIKRHYFVPSKQEVELSFTEEFPKQRVDTEWGKEEIYALLEALPLEAPPGFVPAKTRTNVIKVDV